MNLSANSLRARAAGLALLGALAGAQLTACATMRPPYSADTVSKLGNVSERVYVTSINERVLPDGTMKVAVFAESDTRFDQQIEYRVRWFDANGSPIETSVDAPVRRNIDGKTSFDFVATGPGPKAKTYKIDITTQGE